MRDAPYVVPSRWPLTPWHVSQEAEAARRWHLERAGHLRDQHPHLTALGERIGVLAGVRCGVALARRVIEGAVCLDATLSRERIFASTPPTVVATHERVENPVEKSSPEW